jgi:hypothetical protein
LREATELYISRSSEIVAPPAVRTVSAPSAGEE